MILKSEVVQRLGRLERDMYGQECPGDTIVSRIEELQDLCGKLDKKMQKYQTAEENLKDFQDKYEKECYKNRGLEKEIAELKNEIEKKHELLDEQKTAVNQLIEQRENDKNKYEQQLNEKKHSVEELNQKLEDEKLICLKRKEEIDELELKMEKEKESVEKLESELDKLHNAAQEKEKEYQDTIDYIMKEMENQREELQQREEALSREKVVNKQYTDKFGNWDTDTQEYTELLEALFQCDSLVPMIEKYNLEKTAGCEDVANLIRFIGLMGNDSKSFLTILFKYLEKYKNSNRQFLNASERELFLRINAYYKSKYKVSYDMIVYPEMGDKFDKISMKDMDVRTKVYRTVEGVYVPGIRRDESSFLFQAFVKGE